MGKIYKIVDISYNKCYYGSTVQELSSRMTGHRQSYKRFKNGKGGLVMTYNIFDEFGVDNCKIELAELFPCNSKSELEAREGFHIKNNECVNKFIAGRSVRQYHIDHKEIIAEQKKKYYQNNKNSMIARSKVYAEKNKESIALKHKEYYEINKELIALKHKEYYEKKALKKLET